MHQKHSTTEMANTICNLGRIDAVTSKSCKLYVKESKYGVLSTQMTEVSSVNSCRCGDPLSVGWSQIITSDFSVEAHITHKLSISLSVCPQIIYFEIISDSALNN